MDGNDNSANRIRWNELPDVVRAEIEHRSGARVRAATTQPGGFSHGLAARLELSDGRDVFVKAIDSDDSLAAMYRTELETAARLPSTAPAPALRFSLDTPGWLVAIFDYVPGHHPRLDRPAELAEIRRTPATRRPGRLVAAQPRQARRAGIDLDRPRRRRNTAAHRPAPGQHAAPTRRRHRGPRLGMALPRSRVDRPSRTQPGHRRARNRYRSAPRHPSGDQ